ncbi:MAG TPA: nuclear transport factor 2 family protein [Thermoleophilaceae bacterium]
MARHDVEPVRQRVWVRERSSRTLDQRLNLRFTGIARISARLVAKLSPRSRIRQAALLRAVRLSFEAYNRRDLDAAVAGWDPDFEYFPDRDWVRAGLVEPSYRGVEGYRTYIATADEVWGGQIEPLEVIDTGEQFVVLGEIAGTMRGQARGVPLTQQYVGVVSLSDGIPVRCDEYFDRAKGLAAVGLDD